MNISNRRIQKSLYNLSNDHFYGYRMGAGLTSATPFEADGATVNEVYAMQ